MKFINPDVLILLSISSFIFDSVDQCYTGGAIWSLGPLSNNSYTI